MNGEGTKGTDDNDQSRAVASDSPRSSSPPHQRSSVPISVPSSPGLTVWVDGDACPVKADIVRVCKRYGLVPRFVSNKVTVSDAGRKDLEAITVPGGIDVADDYIVERLKPGDVVLTGDIPLASRAIKASGHALDFRGRWFTERNIGDLMAGRELNRFLRDRGELFDGPRSPSSADRTLFLREFNNFLDRAVRRRPS